MILNNYNRLVIKPKEITKYKLSNRINKWPEWIEGLLLKR